MRGVLKTEWPEMGEITRMKLGYCTIKAVSLCVHSLEIPCMQLNLLALTVQNNNKNNKFTLLHHFVYFRVLANKI